MIDSVKMDRHLLRETVYQLARYKLQEQLTCENANDMEALSQALEIAIQGVEAFSRRSDQKLEALREPGQPQEKQHTFPNTLGKGVLPVARPAPPVPDVFVQKIPPGAKTQGKAADPKLPWRSACLLAMVFAIAVAVQQRGTILESLRSKPNLVNAPNASEPMSAPAVFRQATQKISENPAATLSPLVPTSYGVYAVSQDKLYALELLPGRAPDIRVAISPAILTSSRTMLPDGHLKFVVFRRDSETSAADRADVRIIAKIERAMSFDEAGKAVAAKADDAWVIRNISVPYRTAPSKDSPDMYEIQSDNPELALSPGRYALVLEGQAYDFSIAGAVTDPRQCLERVAATNGQFYAECKKP